MNKQTRRVLFAGLVSLTLYGSVNYWYKTQSIQYDHQTGAKPVAFISTVREDVHRRLAARLIWQTVNAGEPLYPGEAIKTSSKSEVRIQFNDSNRYIDLDPDSLVVISSNENEISLDLMDGSLFVAGGENKGAGGPTFTLNSGQGKVDLSHATASLSKSGNNVDVQVLKGRAINENGQDIHTETSEEIQVLSPKSDQPTIVNPEENEPIKFAWQGVPAKSNVSLWFGPSRKELKLLAQTNSSTNSLEKHIPVGKHFFKLVVTDPKDPNKKMESHIHRFEVIGKFPPEALNPTQNSHLVMNKGINPVTFKWSAAEDASSVQVEIAKDAQFKDKIFTQNFNKEETLTQSLPFGEYFWRLSSTYEGINKSFATKAIRFSISDKPQFALKILWQPQQDQEVQYFIHEPTVKMAWTVDKKEQVKSWKVHIWPASLGRQPSAESDKIVNTNKLEATSEVPEAGKYNIQVEAFNEHNAYLASSEIKTIVATLEPLLPAPNFTPESGDLNADQRGNLSLMWTGFKEAKEYELILSDNDGKEIKRRKFQKNTTSLVNLMPGFYQIYVLAIDKYGRGSEQGKARTVIVPDNSGLKAPVLKKVQVD